MPFAVESTAERPHATGMSEHNEAAQEKGPVEASEREPDPELTEAPEGAREDEKHGKISKASKRPREIGGPKGPEPTRYGDWEKNGRCIDF